MYGVWKPRRVIDAYARWLKVRLRNCLRWEIGLVKPLDGHDLPLLLDVFENIKHVEGPVIVQVVTKKGKGWEHAENDSTKWHGPGAYDFATGVIKKNLNDPPTYTEVFANTLVEMAEKDKTIVGITAAMAEGTGLKKMHQRFPERYFDVGIAEQHA